MTGHFAPCRVCMHAKSLHSDSGWCTHTLPTDPAVDDSGDEWVCMCSGYKPTWLSRLTEQSDARSGS